MTELGVSNSPPPSRAFTASLVAGAIVVLVAATVLIGWHVGSAAIVRIHPSLMPMQYITASGFLFLGIGLIAIHRSRWISAGCAIVVLVLGALSLVEYLWKVNLGIDELVVSDFVTPDVPYPGRMSPNTATAFSLAALSLLMIALPIKHPIRVFTALILGALIVGLGLTSLGGYLFGIEKAYGWGSFTGMAVHTASTFIISAIGLWAAAAIHSRLGTIILGFGLASAVAVGGAIPTVLVSLALADQEDRQIRQLAESTALAQARQLETALVRVHQSLARMGLRWSLIDGVPRAKWSADAQAYVEQVPDVDIIALIGPDLRMEWAVSHDTPSVTATLDNYIDRVSLEAAIARARRENTCISLPAAGLPGTPASVVTTCPLYKHGSANGFLLAVSRCEAMLRPHLEQLAATGWTAEISQDDRTLISVGESPSPGAEATTVIDSPFGRWTMRAAPSKTLAASMHSAYPTVILISGLTLLSTALSVCMLLMNRYRTAALRLRAANLSLDQSQRALEEQLVEVQKGEAALREINQVLALRNIELDEFAEIASHDLQEPLRRMTSFSGLLRTDLGKDLPLKAETDLRFIEVSAERMRRLIQALLALSKAGKSAMKIEKVSIADCIHDAIEANALSIEETGIKIDVPTNLPVVRADRVLLSQVFQNLISNAIKFTADNEAPQIEITLESRRDELILGVRDNGIGVDPRYVDRIFKPFRRLHSNDRYRGTGIGLSICRKVAERHGGRIWVEPVTSGGSHFKFTIDPNLAPVDSN